MPQLTPKTEKFVLSPIGKTYDSPDTPTAVTFAVGPEGGLSPKEINTPNRKRILQLQTRQQSPKNRNGSSCCRARLLKLCGVTFAKPPCG